VSGPFAWGVGLGPALILPGALAVRLAGVSYWVPGATVWVANFSLLAALFLSLIDNILPLFHQPSEYSQMTIGVLILLALVLYSAPELLNRFRTSRAGVGRLETGDGEPAS